ncbi:MAG: aspartyl/asparaginyl beta-hydroxylase domain-containing protein [Parasphingopyxis sp.]|nr:aspartyl/asparaginyl beta-hydroxylase domain-containing protein [Sphingomonadales bacterium]
MSLSDQTPDQLLEIFRSQRRNAQLALYVGAKLDEAGREEEAVAIWSLGDDINPGLRQAKDDPQAPAEMRAHSARADEVFRRFFSDLHRRTVEEFGAREGADVSRVRNAVWSMTHDADFAFQAPMQQPTVFYMPDLPASPSIPRSELRWAAAIEAAWHDIRREYEQAARDTRMMEPYVPADIPAPEWQKLSGTLDWSAIYLFEKSRPTGLEKHFPKTMAAFETADLVRVDGNPMEIFFSRLTPGAHIPPHHGLTNTRLTVHLPLIVPDDCAIRVGESEFHWTEGEILAFDDSYEHEAWNRSDRDRVVLIFETHHPDLSEAEKRAIEHAYTARQKWLDRRETLLGL